LSDFDGNWLKLVRMGDQEAFTNLVEKYQRPVFNLCYRMTGNVEEAEDAAQETFWRAFQAINRYDPQRSFITWLLSIAAHYCIDQQRRRKLPTIDLDILPEEMIPGNTPDPEKETFRNEENFEIRQALSTLNAQDRAAMILRYWYDFSEEEIGATLNLSVSAVKSRLFRARQQMARVWQSRQLNPLPAGGL
jgi:RNA polymerase sigma-70 factor, ECF subfamily